MRRDQTETDIMADIDGNSLTAEELEHVKKFREAHASKVGQRERFEKITTHTYTVAGTALTRHSARRSR
jgi:hypothetical protein